MYWSLVEDKNLESKKEIRGVADFDFVKLGALYDFIKDLICALILACLTYLWELHFFLSKHYCLRYQ